MDREEISTLIEKLTMFKEKDKGKIFNKEEKGNLLSIIQNLTEPVTFEKLDEVLINQSQIDANVKRSNFDKVSKMHDGNDLTKLRIKIKSLEILKLAYESPDHSFTIDNDSDIICKEAIKKLENEDLLKSLDSIIERFKLTDKGLKEAENLMKKN